MHGRVLGLETEYALSVVRTDGEVIENMGKIGRELVEGAVGSSRASGQFAPNGGRCYLDVGEHPEWATPECTTPLDVVRFDKAGQQQLEASRAALLRRHGGTYRDIRLLRNNVDGGSATWGTHENYQVRRAHAKERIAYLLAGHLATRSVFTGAGVVRHHGGVASFVPHTGPDPDARFELSQRAVHMATVTSKDSTSHRPLVNLRDETHADAEQWQRLELLCGDSNCNEWASWLKLATTELVIQLIERAPEVAETLVLADPVGVLRSVSLDVTCKDVYTLADGRKMRALDVQQALAAAVEVYAVTCAADEVVVEEWQRMLELVAGGDLEQMARRIDWAAKLLAIQRYCDRRGAGMPSAAVRAIDFSYHDTDPGRSLYETMLASGRIDRLLTDTEIREATYVPPRDTRAAVRGRLAAHAQSADVRVLIDWVRIGVLTPAGEIAADLLLLDPLQTTHGREAALHGAIEAVKGAKG